MPMPQPNFVPLSPISSRMTHRSGVSSAISTETDRSLSLKVVMITRLQTDFSLRRRSFLADCRHLALDVRPGWKFCARAAQICSQPCNVGGGDCTARTRRHPPRDTPAAAHGLEDKTH